MRDLFREGIQAGKRHCSVNLVEFGIETELGYIVLAVVGESSQQPYIAVLRCAGDGHMAGFDRAGWSKLRCIE